jgi:fumarylacetoacetase
MTLASWLPTPPDSDFPIQNLPYGVFRRPGNAPRVGVAIGEYVLDLAAVHEAGLFVFKPGRPIQLPVNIFARDGLNDLMRLPRGARALVRACIQDLLAEGGDPAVRQNAELRAQALIPQSKVQMLLPARIGDYTDFYASEHHAANVGRMFRPDNPLLPNWKHLPVGYHGRASSIVVSGTPVKRPNGQIKPPDAPAPLFGPTRELDYELEMGFFTGPGNALGSPIPIGRAHEHIFGLVLLNDWSARDVQRWEYQPLGPFLGKSFATSISPWVVPLEALEPFRLSAPPQAPPALPYLQDDKAWAFDITLEVWLQTAPMREPVRLSAGNFKEMYWTIAQMLAHQTSNGVNAQPGDLYGSGTVSGPAEESRGCLLELAWQGTRPLRLPGGETRTFLEDGDTVIMRGWCAGDGYRVGFGEVRGTIAGR